MVWSLAIFVAPLEALSKCFLKQSWSRNGKFWLGAVSFGLQPQWQSPIPIAALVVTRIHCPSTTTSPATMSSCRKSWKTYSHSRAMPFHQKPPMLPHSSTRWGRGKKGKDWREAAAQVQHKRQFLSRGFVDSLSPLQETNSLCSNSSETSETKTCPAFPSSSIHILDFCNHIGPDPVTLCPGQLAGCVLNSSTKPLGEEAHWDALPRHWAEAALQGSSLPCSREWKPED